MLSSFVCLLPDFNLSKILDTDTGSGRSTIANMNPRWLVSGLRAASWVSHGWLVCACLLEGCLVRLPSPNCQPILVLASTEQAPEILDCGFLQTPA